MPNLFFTTSDYETPFVHLHRALEPSPHRAGLLLPIFCSYLLTTSACFFSFKHQNPACTPYFLFPIVFWACFPFSFGEAFQALPSAQPSVVVGEYTSFTILLVLPCLLLYFCVYVSWWQDEGGSMSSVEGKSGTDTRVCGPCNLDGLDKIGLFVAFLSLLHISLFASLGSVLVGRLP
jgi:hypothetical protein